MCNKTFLSIHKKIIIYIKTNFKYLSFSYVILINIKTLIPDKIFKLKLYD